MNPMIDGIDISNLQGHPDTYRNQPWYQDAEFVIVQAIEPPVGFPGYAYIDAETGKRGYTGEQLRTAKADGKYVGVYVWLWNGLADTYADITRRLATVPQSVKLDMRPWVDVEDTAARSVQSRQSDVLIARRAADDWAAQRSLPPSGGYSGQWYVDGYLDQWWPDGWLRWWAGYGLLPGLLIKGDVVMHQYSSTPVDKDVMLESEVVSVEDDERAQMQEQINGLVGALGYLTGDALKPLTRKGAGQYVKTYVDTARSIAEQFGIAHA